MAITTTPFSDNLPLPVSRSGSPGSLTGPFAPGREIFRGPRILRQYVPRAGHFGRDRPLPLTHCERDCDIPRLVAGTHAHKYTGAFVGPGRLDRFRDVGGLRD